MARFVDLKETANTSELRKLYTEINEEHML